MFTLFVTLQNFKPNKKANRKVHFFKRYTKFSFVNTDTRGIEPMKMKSSSTSLSFSSKTNSFGCISLFLQRFLCSGASSTTYPCDQITEPGFESPEFVDEPCRARGGEPGAVARLMGLESLPVIDKTRVVSRSRSVNSGEYVKSDDDEIQGKHRRVKSTLEYVELEDDNFFILSFQKDGNHKVLGEQKRLGRRKYKKKRDSREYQTHIEDKENDINAMNVSPGRERPETGELKQRRKEKRKNMRKRREIKLRQNITENYGRWSRDGDLVNCEVKPMKEEEEECRSCDDSSPVSVLDYDRVTPEPENTSRRRLSSLLESSKSNETVQEDHRSRESEIPVHGNQEMWLMICRLTLSELEESSNSVYRKASKLGDLEGSISEDIASSIFDQLLEETITTLSLTAQV